MSTQNAGGAHPEPLPPPKSGARAALEYTGIPPSWLDKRPKLPSRNWLIFLTVTTSIASYYLYDRRECRRIRKDYVDRVKGLAEEPLGSMDLPRKVTVYGCKWPGDEESDRSMKYFRKYVKPILVAAAVDYEMINGKRHGDLTNKIAEEIKSRRRIEVGLDQPVQSMMALPSLATPEVQRQRELDGGLIIVGRHTYKEFMVGLKRGWTEGLEKVDKEEFMAQELASDGQFDEPLDPGASVQELDGEPIPTPSRLPPSRSAGLYSPIQLSSPVAKPSVTQDTAIPLSKNSPPTFIPALPPFLFVSFTNYIGFKQIPLMLWGLFNERHKVRSGSEAAFRLIMKETRPFAPPSASTQTLETISQFSLTGGDLDFDLEAETYYKKSLSSTPEEIEKARKAYYESLPAKLEITRALARGTREPTKDEINHPPPTEVELRAERLKKELRWRGDLEGWEIVKAEQPVAWDERFWNALRVFRDPPSDTNEGTTTDKDFSHS
ncbi:hypothetical protein SERLA73DRAFT_95243 [Serpula lacrymans var. lacrymans S7.3]|uniref:Mitochondrial import inner membrane translocase subunit TIM54 n=1 Tax=Serpula lacrymans var. lacrymans (strain S7.3) TaxID=936435 RepID=F8Q7X5_SERL3|nr:hypothetical protein SERLA73DRAFT_95243 [Serpula lacrymans var. lacrymans S7.3]